MSKIWPGDDEPSTRYPVYTRGNTGEVFPNVMSLLTATLIGADVQRAQVEVFTEIGVLTPRDLVGPSIGTGVFAGYLYGNGTLARLMGARALGMKPTDADEQVFGTVDGLPPYRRAKGDRNPLATLRIARFLARVLRRPDLSELERARESARKWLATMPPLGSATDDELLTFLETYPARLGASMKRLLWFSMIAGGPRALIDRVLSAPSLPAGLANRLVSGIDGVDSADLAEEQWAMSRIVAASAPLTAAFDAGLDGIEARVAGTELVAAMDDFLARHGHRGNDEYELAAPCWALDPRPVYAAVDRLRRVPDDRDPALARQRLAADRADAEAEVEARVRWPQRRLVLRAAEVSRAGSVGRERAKDILVLENLGARAVLAELARRVGSRGGQDDLRRFCCIAADELPAFVADPGRFAGVIAERAAQAEYLAARVPPPWFEGRIPDPSTWPMRSDVTLSAPGAGTELAGYGVSGGQAAGPARVITDPGDPRGLEPGEVLVCAITDPAWTPLFLVASAVVCDTGALQSHAAIVARELGIPAVMSVPGITSVADGTWLEVDGDLGVVRVGPSGAHRVE